MVNHFQCIVKGLQIKNSSLVQCSLSFPLPFHTKNLLSIEKPRGARHTENSPNAKDWNFFVRLSAKKETPKSKTFRLKTSLNKKRGKRGILSIPKRQGNCTLSDDSNLISIPNMSTIQDVWGNLSQDSTSSSGSGRSNSSSTSSGSYSYNGGTSSYNSGSSSYNSHSSGSSSSWGSHQSSSNRGKGTSSSGNGNSSISSVWGQLWWGGDVSRISTRLS